LEKIAHRSLEKDWDDARQVVCSMENGTVNVHLEPEVLESMEDSTLLKQAVL
ncbi:MAG: hypothetical protein GY757_01455, partial [bacterium]|nr:hypothetical protein [bacterium]